VVCCPPAGPRWSFPPRVSPRCFHVSGFGLGDEPRAAGVQPPRRLRRFAASRLTGLNALTTIVMPRNPAQGSGRENDHEATVPW
jgi:hypothetical protein